MVLARPVIPRECPREMGVSEECRWVNCPAEDCQVRMCPDELRQQAGNEHHLVS